MLVALKEQAKQVVEEDDAPSPSETLEGSEPTEPPRPTPLATPMVTLDAAGKPQVQALSFQPARKAVEGRRGNPDHDLDTSPGILPQDSRVARLVKSRDEEPTEASAPALPMPPPQQEMPSIVVDGLPSESLKTEEMPTRPPPAAPKAAAREREVSGVKRSPAKAAAKPDKAEKAADKAEKSRRPPKRTAERAAAKKEPRSTSPEPPKPASAPASEAPKKGGTSLLAATSRGTCTPSSSRRSSWRKKRPRSTTPRPRPEKSREVKVGGTEEPEQVEPVPEVPDKPDKPDKPKAPTASSPGAKALAALKADYGKLNDEGVAKKYKLKLNALEHEVDSKGEDPGYLQRVDALHEQVKAELQKQQ